MMRIYLVFALLFTFSKLGAQIKADDIVGDWMAVDNTVSVRVYPYKKEYRAKVIWFDERLGNQKPMHLRRDYLNPDPELRQRKIIGMEILEGLIFNPETQSWENGTIYDASSGRHWDSSVTFEKNGNIRVRGYWRVKWIGKSLAFKRINAATIKKQ